MRVGFLYDDSLDRTDGVSHQVKTLGKWLSEQGHEVCYLVGETKMSTWNGGKVYSLSKNKAVKFNGNKLATPIPASAKNIKDVLKKENLDVVHVQMPYSPFMAQKVINRLPSSVGVAGTFHILPANSLTSVGTRLLRLVYGKSLRRIDKLLAVSPAAAVFARTSLGAEFAVLPNAIDISQFQIKNSMHQPNHIVFLGRLVPRKGCLELLRAFRLLKERLPAVTLIIAGDGPLRGQLEKFVSDNNLQDCVKFLGLIDEKDKPKLLSTAAIACFPSLGGESFGIVLIEAMAAGSGVVVGGNNPGYVSVLGENSQVLVDPHSSSEFASRLDKILIEQNLATRLHERQQEQVKQYDVSVVGKQLVEIYRQAIASRRQKP